MVLHMVVDSQLCFALHISRGRFTPRRIRPAMRPSRVRFMRERLQVYILPYNV